MVQVLPPFPQNRPVNSSAGQPPVPMDPQWIAWFNALGKNINGNPFFLVGNFGAKGDGVTDDGPAFQAAINAAAAAGGGIVLVPTALYFFGSASVLNIPAKVQLVGAALGPFDGSSGFGSPPWGPTMLVTNTSTYFLSLNGFGAKVANLLFYYPNQVTPTAATPTVYPPTVYMYGGESYGAQAILGCTFINSYQAIYALGCVRSRIENCIIGAYFRGIVVDEMVDWFIIDNVMFQVMWDEYLNLVWPQTIDTYVLNNTICLTTLRADSVQVSNVSMFGHYAFHYAGDSGVAQPGVKMSYGRMSNIDIDTCAYGIIGFSMNSPGWDYTNICIGANNTGIGTAGQWVALAQAGGTGAPRINISNGSIRGSWAGPGGGPVPFTFVGGAGVIYTEGVRGMMPLGAITAPAFPATGVPYTNPFPFHVYVTYSGAGITGLNLGAGGVYINTTNGSFVFAPGTTATFTYTGVTAWTWTGL